MAYPGPFIRLTFGGPLPGPEEWACGLSFAASNAPLELAAVRHAAGNVSLADVAQDIAQWIQSSDMAFVATTKLKWVKLAVILADGSYDEGWDQNPRQYEFGSMPQGFVNSQSFNTMSLAITLFSGTGLGKGNYGRFYAPPQSLAVIDAATQQISTTSAGNYLSGTVTMLEAIKGEIDSLQTNMHLVIPTQVGTSFKQVQEVRIGRRVDTQRRRARSIPEAYVVDSDVDL